MKMFFYWIVLGILFIFLTHYIYNFINVQKTDNYFGRFDITTLYTPYPYIMFKGSPEDFRYNNLGYRGPVPLKEKDDTFRIFVLGGSSVAVGRPPFSEELEKIFHKEGYEKIRVFNFGAVSSMFGQDVARILYEVVDFHPNLIVIYGGFNDLNHLWYADPRPGYPYNFFVYEKSFPLNLKFSLWGLLYKIPLLRLYFNDFLFNQATDIDKLRKQVGHGSEDWKKQTADAAWNYINKAKKLSSAYDFHLLVVFQAVFYGKKTRHLNEDLHPNSENWNQLFHYFLNSPLRDPEISFFDRSGLFDDISEHVFVDEVHIKQEYRINVAQELFTIITASDKRFQKTDLK